MDECDIMPNSVDRHRFKDRIIESISKAVKNIQLYNSIQGGEHEQPPDVLRNDDWQFCKLVEHLDHAFLHGLRHVTNGYWIVVQEFTHRSTVKEIERLARVVTNLGRSRAWLYQALADHLLESYVRCYIDNVRLIKRYYAQDALLLDEQRLQLLLTLSSGLDLINFELEIDMPYLDLCSHQPVLAYPKPDEDVDSADDVSLHSISSSQSSVSILLETPVKLIDKLRRKEPAATPNNVIVPCNDECNRGAAFTLPIDDDGGQIQTEVLVEHVRGGHKGRKRGVSSRAGRKSEDISASAVSPGTPESGYRSVLEDSMLMPTTSLHDCDRDSPAFVNSAILDTTDGVSVSCYQYPERSKTVLNRPPSDGFLILSENVFDQPACTSESELLGKSSAVQPSAVSQPSTVRSMSEDELLKTILDTHCGLEGSRLSNSNDTEGLSGNVLLSTSFSDANVLPVQLASSFTESNDCLIVELTAAASDELCCPVHSSELVVQADDLDRELSCSVSNNVSLGLETSSTAAFTIKDEEISIYDDAVFNRSSKPSLSEDPLDQVSRASSAEIEYNETKGRESSLELSSSFQSRQPVSGFNFDRIPRANSVSFETSESNHRRSPTSSISSVMSVDASSHPMEVRLDNNLKLLLMLEVFQFDHEKFIKMFRVSAGHTEGEIRPLFLLVTDLALYLLVTSINGQTKYDREAVATYKELDYISLSVNRQMINIICRTRHKQYWITTGDEQLSELIVESLERGLNMKDPNAPKLSVLTDATMQKISLKKFVAAECQIEMQDVELLGYFLIYWEDTDSLSCKELQVDNGCKEGPLLCKTYNYMFGGSAIWSPAYFVLKDGVLYQYDSRNDVSATPRSTVYLRKENCCGCRRVRNGDRNHCFEILFTNGSPLELSALNAAEASEWLQAMCSAVSSSKGPHRSKVSGCLPCCCLVSETRLFMCHEDVRTNFIRTLNSAAIASVKAVYCDPDVDTYCIMAFDTTSQTKVRHEKWAIYFNTGNEKDRFLTIMKQAFNRRALNTLPVQPVESTLSKRCHRGYAKISKLRMP